MKQKPDRPRSSSRPGRPGLGRFAAECIAAGEEPRLSTPLHAGVACALFLPGGGRSGGEDVLGGLCDWPLRPGGSPLKNPGSRSSWNMSTNSCCSSSKVSCRAYGNTRFAQPTDLNAGSTVRISSDDGTRMFWMHPGAYRWRGLAHHVGHLSEEVAHPRQLRIITHKAGNPSAKTNCLPQTKPLIKKQIEPGVEW